MKNQLLAAFEEIPRLGDHRRRLELLVKFRQADHQVGNDIERNMVGGHGPVQAGRLGAEIDAESCCPLCRLSEPVSQAVQKHSRMSASSRRWLKVLFFRENKTCLRIKTFANISSLTATLQERSITWTGKKCCKSM